MNSNNNNNSSDNKTVVDTPDLKLANIEELRAALGAAGGDDGPDDPPPHSIMCPSAPWDQ